MEEEERDALVELLGADTLERLRPEDREALHRGLARLRERYETQRMESLVRLAGGVAHDFNNILTAIKGGVSFALEDLPDDHPVRPDLDQVVVAGERAKELTGRLLAYSRRQPARAAVHDLRDVLARAEPTLRDLAGDGIELRVQTTARPAPVHIDPARFEQVLRSLVANAVDAMPDGGRIDVELDEVSRVDVDGAAAGSAPDGWVRLAVADTGPGIASDARRWVFDPFFTTKRGGTGTGLGLAMVQGIVHQAGGSVSIDESYAKGARLVVRLPRADR